MREGRGIPGACAGPLAVVSGCSGGGKSALLEEMVRRGWTVAPEPGREVVREETAAGGRGLPWIDLARFCALCAEKAAAAHEAALRRGGATLFDRSLVDAAAALERAGLPLPATLEADLEMRRYAPVVFMAPPWPEIFVSDAERRHDLDAARAEHDHLMRRYPAAGYDVEEIPRAPIADRADWLASRLADMRAAA